jgi:hypothetical protein
MPLQILKLKLDAITAGDYLMWCRDPDPPALDFALRSISIDADPLGDTITAILDWAHALPPAPAAASAAGLPLSADVQVHQSPADSPHAWLGDGGTRSPSEQVGGGDLPVADPQNDPYQSQSSFLAARA